MTQPAPPPRFGRRQLLRSAVLLTPLVVWPGLVRAAAANPAPRRLAFYHTHTGETLDIVYSEGGTYVPEALSEIRHLCRDFRTGDIHAIDPALLDVLHDVQQVVGNTGRFEIISAFRSPLTNSMLARTGSGVADHSLHLKGQAIDVRLPGSATADLRRAGLRLARGGVGYYPEADFVHLDTGRVRTW